MQKGGLKSLSPPATHIDDVLDALNEPALLLILDGVTDPHNLGACLRVADAMGVHAVIAPKDRAVGLNATVAKVASGAAETVPYIPVTKLDGARALVLGAEGEGMRRLTRENCDELVRIPILGGVESLNVSVSAGICLYEARRQRGFGK